MRLDWIALESFRSYRSLEWTPAPSINVLVGSNGAGKTNLLEAVGYLAQLGSFRGAPDEALVEHGFEQAVVRGEVSVGDATTLIEIELKTRGGRRAMVNRQRLGRAADLLGYVRVVGFLPDDLDIVKRGPARRRDFLDQVAVQLWPGSHLDQAEYQRALRQRNAFLKQRVDDEVTLGVWDERLAQAGGKVMARRARVVAVLEPYLGTAHREIALDDTSIEIGYVSEWGGAVDPSIPAGSFAQRLADALARRRRVDLERRVTTVGPHRDEPVVLHGGHDLRFHGSQGEQRTVALGLRLATHRAVAETVGAPPILLLDDVYSELDPARGKALTRALPSAQTLVTTADPSHVPLEGTTWRVGEEGVVAR